MAPAEKNIGGAKSDIVIYDVTNQILECDADKPTEVATSEWLVVTLVRTRNGLMCIVQLYTSRLAKEEQTKAAYSRPIIPSPNSKFE